jgi:hypothetical protein
VLALGILLLLLSRRNPLWGGLFAPLMLVEPHFLSHVLNGQDLYVISLALVAITLLLMEVKDHVGHVLLLGLLGGVIATSRIPIVGMLVVLGFDLWRRNRRSGAIFLVSMCSVTLLLHGIFFIWAMHNGDVYQPTHYLSRPSYQLVKPVMVLLALAALLWIYRSKPSTSNWLLGIFLVMAALFTPEGIAEFLPVNNPGWEALNYVCFPIPVLLAAIVCRTHQESGAQIISHQMEESAV